MRRFVVLLALFCLLRAVAQSPAQESPQAPSNPSQANAENAQVVPELADAEAAIVKADWKTAAAKLDAYLATHATDARALFDAGYVADHQDHLDVAAGFYRRAIDANPNSFEAHLALGLLLARQGKKDEAHTELLAATTLDPGEAGPALKARAWRALARLDKPGPDGEGNATEASNELLEALKLTPETTDDTLLAADLAEASGQHEAAEAAYRRVLADNPKSVAANSGLAHVFIGRKHFLKLKSSSAPRCSSNRRSALNAQLATVLAAQDDAERCRFSKSSTPPIPPIPQSPACLPAYSPVRRCCRLRQALLPLLAKSPDDVDLLVAHGQNLIRQQRFTEALAAFDKATKLDSADADAWSGIAFAASKLHQPELAVHALTVRSKYLPGGASNLLSLGHILRLIERPERRRSPTITTFWIHPAANSQIRNGRRAKGS